MGIFGDDTSSMHRWLLFVLIFISVTSFFRIGYQFVIVAWHAVQITGSAAAVGKILFVSSVVSLLCAPVLGRVIDACVDKRLLMVAGHAGVSVLVAVPLLYGMEADGGISFVLLIGIATLTGAWSVLSIGAMDYFLKTHTSAGNRLRSLALMNAGNQIALISGTGAGGLALSSFAIRPLFFADAILALIPVVISIFLLPALKIGKIVMPHRVKKAQPLRDHFFLYAGYPQLFLVACCSALVFALGQITNTLLPAFLNLYLQRSSADYALAEICWAGGAFLAGIFLGHKIGHRNALGGHDFGLIMAMAILLALVPYAGFFWVLLLIHFFLGAGFSTIRIRNESRFLMCCPVGLLGRFRANSLIVNSVFGFAVYAVPILMQHWQIQYLYLVLAALISAAAIMLALVERHHQAGVKKNVVITNRR